MPTNPFQTSDRDLERKLNRLEQNYEKDTAHYRKHHGDLQDIQQLLNAGKIDTEHATHLAAASKAAFDATQTKTNEKRKEVELAEFEQRHYGKVFAALLLMCVLVVACVSNALTS